MNVLPFVYKIVFVVSSEHGQIALNICSDFSGYFHFCVLFH